MRLASFTRPVAILTLISALAGCATRQEIVSNKEDLLAASGFRFQPANTPQRLAALQSLPPNRFMVRTEGNKVRYLFADPLVCGCLYVGDQAAWGRYQQLVFQRQLANQQQMTADALASTQWDWGPWGPFGFGPY